MNKHLPVVFVSAVVALGLHGSASADAEEDAMALAFDIGAIETFAAHCNAPSSSFAPVVHEARALLPAVYRRAKLNASSTTLEMDVAAGAASFKANANMGCDHFRRGVSGLLIRTRRLEGRRAPKALAPYDPPNWPGQSAAAQ
jgi:hypothetical protein